MRLLALLLTLLPSLALAQGPRVVRDLGAVLTGPRVLGEPAFAFELDALSWDEPDRAGWPITTTRPSECMTYTGSEWVTRGEDEACVDSQGLQAFEGFTQYVRSTGPFDAHPWFLGASSVVEDQGGGVWRGTSGELASYVAHAGPAVSTGETWTITAEVRNATTGAVRLRALNAASAGGSLVTCTRSVGPEWTTVACTQTAVADGSAQATLYFDSGSARGSVEFRQIQLTKTPHPMPRHDCGPSPCSRAGEVHTVSTEGWPVEAGEVRLQYTPMEDASPTPRYLLSAEMFGQVGWTLYIRDGTKGLAFLVANGAGGSTTHLGSDLTWTAGQTYDIRAVWGGGMVRIFRDGLLVLESSGQMPLGPLPSDARVGGRPGDPNRANGHIRLLRVSTP